MIRLTRLRQTDPLYINPDHIERLDRHHETIVHLLNGTEYVVVESPEEILEQVTMLRARVIATAARMVSEQQAPTPADVAQVHVVAATPGLPTVVSPDDEDSVSSGEGV
jgi:flagellar protein FlbD